MYLNFIAFLLIKLEGVLKITDQSLIIFFKSHYPRKRIFNFFCIGSAEEMTAVFTKSKQMYFWRALNS